MFPVILHVKLSYHYGYHFINFSFILLSYPISDLQRSFTYCYRYTAILSFRDLILIVLECLYVAPKGEPR